MLGVLLFNRLISNTNFLAGLFYYFYCIREFTSCDRESNNLKFEINNLKQSDNLKNKCRKMPENLLKSVAR